MAAIDDLLSYLATSPSPYHAAANAAARLDAAGFARLSLDDAWPEGPGAFYVVRGGALIAWFVGPEVGPDAGFRILGAHTDSPNLRLEPLPDTGGSGWKQLGVEVYGGALWNSWLDRDLGLSGRVQLAAAGSEPLLVLVDDPVARVPQLAIHLDRDVNSKGLSLNPQHHLTPVWATGDPRRGDLAAWLVGVVNQQHGTSIAEGDILGWDLMFHDVTPPRAIGRDRDLIASARLDDLVSCWAAVETLTGIAQAAVSWSRPTIPVACLYDHEEVGSTSATGADGALLAQILERSVLARDGGRDDFLRALAGSLCLSADMAHATHPNYPDRHDADHPVRVNAGPVIKVNANQRYATDATTAGILRAACRERGIAHQWFVGRNDQPCGSTIGPVTAARLGVPTIDVGVAQLSMHSARELCGAEDPALLVDTMAAFTAVDRQA